MSIFSSITDKTIDFALKVASFAIILLALWGFGKVIEANIEFTFLTTFFTLVRRFLSVFDFAFDTTTLITLFTSVMAVQVGLWTYRGYRYVLGIFSSDLIQGVVSRGGANLLKKK